MVQEGEEREKGEEGQEKEWRTTQLHYNSGERQQKWSVGLIFG